MASTDKGVIAAASLFCGDGAINAYNVTNARLGVGDGSTAFAASQTDLQGTNKLRHALDSAPSRTNNSVDYTATFGSSEANFAWNELALFNSASGDYMATRRLLSGFGTKAITDTWTIVASVVFTAS